MQADRGVSNKLDLTSSGERWNGQWTVVYCRAISQIRLTELWLILGFLLNSNDFICFAGREANSDSDSRQRERVNTVLLCQDDSAKQFVKPIILYHKG